MKMQIAYNLFGFRRSQPVIQQAEPTKGQGNGVADHGLLTAWRAYARIDS